MSQPYQISHLSDVKCGLPLSLPDRSQVSRWRVIGFFCRVTRGWTGSRLTSDHFRSDILTISLKLKVKMVIKCRSRASWRSGYLIVSKDHFKNITNTVNVKSERSDYGQDRFGSVVKLFRFQTLSEIWRILFGFVRFTKLDRFRYKKKYIKWSSLALKISNRMIEWTEQPEKPKFKRLIIEPNFVWFAKPNVRISDINFYYFNLSTVAWVNNSNHYFLGIQKRFNFLA